jgi:hypothetical protein
MSTAAIIIIITPPPTRPKSAAAANEQTAQQVAAAVRAALDALEAGEPAVRDTSGGYDPGIRECAGPGDKL